MASRPKRKMSPQERAKQFMPFSALKGLEEALKERERVVVPKPELAEDAEEEIDRKLKLLESLMKVTIIHYHDMQCVKTTGVVAKFDPVGRYVQIVDSKIEFDNILSLELQ